MSQGRFTPESHRNAVHIPVRFLCVPRVIQQPINLTAFGVPLTMYWHSQQFTKAGHLEHSVVNAPEMRLSGTTFWCELALKVSLINESNKE